MNYDILRIRKKAYYHCLDGGLPFIGAFGEEHFKKCKKCAIYYTGKEWKK